MVDRAIGLCECEIIVIGSRSPHQYVVGVYQFISSTNFPTVFSQYER